MKVQTILVLMILLASSLAFSTSYDGDGRFNLSINDRITSENQFEVTLVNISSTYTRDQQLIYTNATYRIRYDGSEIANVTLAEGESYNAVARSGRRNVTIRLEDIWNSTSGGLAAVIRVPHANTRIQSYSYNPPVPDLSITNLSANASLFSAKIKLTTNTSANATFYVYNSTRASIMRTVDANQMLTEHTIDIGNLKSDYNYFVYVYACTNTTCIESEPVRFTTLPVIPEITNVRSNSVTNDSARILWNTDVVSDSIVYYRKSGETEWIRIPPIGHIDIGNIVSHLPIDISVIDPLGPISMPSDIVIHTQEREVYSLASGPGMSPGASAITPSKVQIKTNIGGGVSGTGQYSITTDYPLSEIMDKNVFTYIFTQSHEMILTGLEDNKTYQYKVSSCADRCAESAISTFKTNKTIYNPYVNFVLYPSSIQHGSSAVLTLSAYSQNAGASLTDVTISWNDQGTTKSFHPVFGGNSKSFVPGTYETLSVASITFADTGSHWVKLWAKDTKGKESEKTIYINVIGNSQCSATGAKYYPTDTSCTNEWPNDGQAGINYNNGIGACHAFEVCSDNLDYMAADAETCCNGERIFSDEPTKNWGYGYSKVATCDVAVADSKSKGAMTSLSSESSMKYCKAAYLVRGIGSQAVYVKDYYTAEACCKDASFCGNAGPRFQAYTPWPMANIKYGQLWCYYTDWGIFGKTAKDGWYGSDTNAEANNNALADFPAHATVNTMNTGTCVDYSFVVTTSLRKIGFSKNQIMSMRTPGHLYNVVWLPGDSKYSFIDTVGNTGGDFFTGGGWGWTSGGKNVDHCSYSSDKCSNDGGMKNCPSKSQVYGC